MRRHAAFVRGIMPTNAKMPELRKCFEAAGFTEVETVLGSGNVVFVARPAAPATLEKKAEAAMHERLGRTFLTIVRPMDALRALLADDPYASLRLPAGAKRVVTFLREPPVKQVALPAEVDGARIVGVRGSEVFCAYVPSPKGAVFMTLIEKTFGKEATTRTWETVHKVVARDR